MRKLPTALVCLAATLLTAGAASANLIVGVNDDVKYEASVPEFFLPTMQSERLKTNALTIRWDETVPTDIPADLTDYVNSVITSASAAGVTVELDLYPLHSQVFTGAAKCSPSPDPEACGDTAMIQQFAAWTAIVARAFPTVRQFIVMNECNQPLFVNPQWDSSDQNQSAAICGRALAASYDALHAVNSSNFVWGVGLSPRGNDSPNAASNSSTSPVKFLNALGAWFKSFAAKTHRTRPLMDGLDFHPYPVPQSLPFATGYATPNSASISNLPRIYQAFYDGFSGSPQKTIGQQAGGGLPFSLNEMGIQTDTTGQLGYVGSEVSANAAGGVVGATATEAYQASYYQQTLDLLACDPNVRVMNFFHLVDEPNLAGWQSGLYWFGTTTPLPKQSAQVVHDWIARTSGKCQGTVTPWTPAGVPAGVTTTTTIPFAPSVRHPKPAQTLVAIGSGLGAGKVKVYNGGNFALRASAAPLGPAFTGGVFVAAGDVNGDGQTDIVCGTGPGGLPRVTILNGANGKTIASYLAFPSSFRGGVAVAVGDVNGDGKSDVIVGAASGGSQVKVFGGTSKIALESFLPFAASFTGGVSVAAGDVNGDGRSDVIVGAGGGGAQVKVFSGATTTVLESFLPFAASFAGGVSVGAGDVNGDGKADVVAGAASGGQQVKVFSAATTSILKSFLPFAASFTGGVTVAAGDVTGDGKADIVVGTAGGSPQVKVFSGSVGNVLHSFLPFAAPFVGGARVAVY